MSRIHRIKEYSKPTKGWQGNARDQANIDRWSERATAESKLAPRATDHEIKLPSTAMTLKDTKMPAGDGGDPERKFKKAKADLNHDGSNYMKSIRRNA
jgi:hypothetical protein